MNEDKEFSAGGSVEAKLYTARYEPLQDIGAYLVREFATS